MIRWLDARKDSLFLLLLLIAALAFFYYLAKRPPAGELVIIEPDEATSYARQFRVYVGGEVPEPGVYVLPVGARVSDAIERAGGMTDRTDLSQLDLARRVVDEESIIVPPVRDQSVRLLNLNHAGQPELEALPSIGPVTAKRILQHRESRGEFVNLQQLLRLKLIHQGQFDAIRELVTVE